jgi:hypothetical protein
MRRLQAAHGLAVVAWMPSIQEASTASSTKKKLAGTENDECQVWSGLSSWQAQQSHPCLHPCLDSTRCSSLHVHRSPPRQQLLPFIDCLDISQQTPGWKEQGQQPPHRRPWPSVLHLEHHNLTITPARLPGRTGCSIFGSAWFHSCESTITVELGCCDGVTQV